MDQDSADREAIRTLIHRYASLVDRGELQEAVALFSHDGALVVDQGRFQGADEISGFFDETTERFRAAGLHRTRARHHVTTTDVQLTSGPGDSKDEGECLVYFAVIDGSGFDHWGTYRDRVVRTPAGWRFSERSVRVEGARDGSLALDRRQPGS